MSAPRWSIPLHTPFSDVLVPRSDGTVLAGGLEWDDATGALVAADLQLIDAASGVVRWKRARNGDTTIISAEDPLLVLTRTAQESRLTSIGPRGETVWTTVLDPFAAIDLTDGGDLIISDARGAQRVAVTTGHVMWTSRATGTVRCMGSTVLLLGEQTAALDLATGKTLWTAEGVKQLVDVLETSSGYVIADSRATRLLERATGNVSWSHPVTFVTRLMPADETGVFVVATDDHQRAFELQWLELASGTKRWGVASSSAPTGTPVVDQMGVVCPYAAVLVRFDVRDGKQLAVARLPLALVGDGLPDALWSTGEQLYLRRERGLAAVDAKTLRLTWWQPFLYSQELRYERFAQERDRWLADVKAVTPAKAQYVAARGEQDRTWSKIADAFASSARAEKVRVFADRMSSFGARMDALDNLQGAVGYQRAVTHMNAHFERMRTTLDLVNSVAALAAEMLQAQLDEYQESVNKDRLAMAAVARTNITTLSRYLNAPTMLALQPVMHGQPRIGLALIDPAGRTGVIAWVAPRVQNEPPLAALAPDGKQLYVVGVPPDPALLEGFVVRESVRPGLAISAFPIPELQPLDAITRLSGQQGNDGLDVELPRRMLERDYGAIYRDHANVTCKELPTHVYAGGTLLEHALQADEVAIADVLQSKSYSLTKTRGKPGSTMQAVLQFASEDVSSFVRTGAAKVPGRRLYGASAAGDENAALAALKAGADPNAGAYIPRCDFGPLHFAVYKQMPALVDALLKAGAWVDFVSPEGTPLDLAEKYRVPASIKARLVRSGAQRSSALETKRD